MAEPSDRAATEFDRAASVVVEDLLANDEDDVRFVFTYDASSIDVVYVREDMLERDLVPRLDAVHSRALDEWDRGAERIRSLYGDRELTIAIRDAVVVIHFLGREESGIVAVADRSSGVLSRLLGM